MLEEERIGKICEALKETLKLKKETYQVIKALRIDDLKIYCQN